MKTLSLFDFDKPSDKPKEKRSVVINPDIKLIDQDGLKVLIVANYPIFAYSPSDVDRLLRNIKSCVLFDAIRSKRHHKYI